MAGKTGKGRRNKESAAQRHCKRRGEVFPPRTMSAREEGAAMASAARPEKDWRPELQSRFVLDGNLTPCQLDGFDPGEPDRYDYADIQEAHALAHVPLWKIDDSQVKLLFDYGYATSSVFRLGLLMAEEEPFLAGSVFGDILPALAGQIDYEYDPVADTISCASQEMDFRRTVVAAVMRRAEEILTDPSDESEDDDIAILTEAKTIARGPTRLAMIESEVSVVERRRGGLRVVPVSGSQKGPLAPPVDIEADLAANKTRKRKLTFYIIGLGTKPTYAVAFDSSERPVQCDAYFGRLDLDAAKAGMKTLYEVPTQGWIDFT